MLKQPISLGNALTLRFSTGLDAGWCRLRVGVNAPPFGGEFECDALHADLADLETALEELHSDLEASVSWANSYAGNVSINAAGDGLGHIEISADLVPDFYRGPRLSMVFELDQSYLPAIIRSVRHEAEAAASALEE
jgi:hypothetical protein